jgi:hypothetical protein
MKNKIVLDLDNTLVCTVNKHHMIRLLNNRQLSLPLQYIDVDEDHISYLRPYLFDFLDTIFQQFDVSVFTAAGTGYANIVVDKIFSNYHLDGVLSNPDYQECLFLNGKHKYIDYISTKINGYERVNTRIIDDSNLVAMSNPDNIIRVKAFDVLSFDGELNMDCLKDIELKRLMDYFNNGYF